MGLFIIFPIVISLIIFASLIVFVIRIIRFSFKVGKNVSQTILEKTNPKKHKDKNKKSDTLYADEEISVRLKQDLYSTKFTNYTVCKYCGCKNRKNVFRCTSCNAPLNE